MALIKLSMTSKALGRETKVCLAMPERDYMAQAGEGEIPVLYCLHGGCADYTDMLRNSSIEEHARKNNLVAVMPSAGMSRWYNEKRGELIEDFVVEELPGFLHTLFPKLSTKREKTWITGFSMGGSGALTYAMMYPEKYSQALIISTSSVIPLEHLRQAVGKIWVPEGCMDTTELTFGTPDSGEMKGTRYDVLWQSEQNVREGKPLPRIRLAVGTQDHGFEVCLALRQHFLSLEGNPYGFEFYSEVAPHCWEFADKWIGRFLAMI